MNYASSLFAVSAVIVLGLFAPAQAAPASIAGSLATEELVIRVHSFHCDPEWNHRYGWHRHWGACQRAYPQYHRGHGYWSDRRHHHHQHGAPRWY